MQSAVFIKRLVLMIAIIERSKAYCRLSELNTMLKINGVNEVMYRQVMEGENNGTRN